jgi:hypothetical protein
LAEKNVPSDGEVLGGCLVDMQDDNKWVRGGTVSLLGNVKFSRVVQLG